MSLFITYKNQIVKFFDFRPCFRQGSMVRHTSTIWRTGRLAFRKDF